MDRQKKELFKYYKQCIRRVERENDIIGRARDRKYYWQNKTKILSEKIDLIQNGKLGLFNPTKEML